MAESRVRAPAE